METRLHFDQALLPGGWADDVAVRIRGGRIASLTVNAAPDPAAERHGIALPGIPNLHSHAFQRALAGLTARRGDSEDSFWTWREAMYRFVDRLDPDGVAAIAALAYVEMLEAGFTRVGEFHYLHHGPDGAPYGDRAEMAAAIARAVGETGIALTLLPVFYARSGFGGAPAGAGQRRFANDIDGFAELLEGARRHLDRLPDAVLGVAPHSLRAVTPEELSMVAGLSEGPIHIHIAEQVREVEDCVAWSGARPVEWLMANQPVDARWCLVHATHMTDAETDALARSGAVAGLCPVTEADLGDGIFPAERYFTGGGRFGIGTDSNVRVDAAGELRLLEYGQRLSQRRRNVLADAGTSTGARLVTDAIAGGAQALGAVAALREGAPADIVTLPADAPDFVARAGDALLDSFVFGRGALDCVWRAGVKQVESGRHRARDAVAVRYRAAVERVLA
ncbi:formimidoylglutamate deiminase [Stakelama saccharophila]|uniref:Formimidoylglutamate deiminase n=1 Tax=Stakelama saccharophila TaxID=3075605 RepID=A0ABZ0BA28_9SPHN|nr:formimidoylglutamate deiminase [Stakelama sp. W311]WNO54208.1 formimidoylglutamate deiminase [Stakelama sp. W311]